MDTDSAFQGQQDRSGIIPMAPDGGDPHVPWCRSDVSGEESVNGSSKHTKGTILLQYCVGDINSPCTDATLGAD